MGGVPISMIEGPINCDLSKRPVRLVSYNDIAGEDGTGGDDTFLGRTGLRLPTEAEWEYACRAFTTTPFCFGETISTDQANYDGNYTYGNGKLGTYLAGRAIVGSYPANKLGFHDMHGNVAEWCADWFDNVHYAKCKDGVTDPLGPAAGSTRVVRGGSWGSIPLYVRSAYRYDERPTVSSNVVGFRVARTP
jgi:formylglycine-generating enzyme required for sulfatase activity